MEEKYLNLKLSLEEGLRDDRMAEVATAGGGGVSRVSCAVSREVRGHDSRVAW